MVILRCNQDGLKLQPKFSTLNEESLKTFEIIHSGVIQVTLSKTHLSVCSRCRRYTSSDGNMCSSCLDVLSLENNV